MPGKIQEKPAVAKAHAVAERAHKPLVGMAWDVVDGLVRGHDRAHARVCAGRQPVPFTVAVQFVP